VTHRRARTCAALALVLLAAACGRKGNPLPPLPFAPARVGDPEIHRMADRIELRFAIPAANADGTTPSVLNRVDVYALATPAGAAAPSVAKIIDPANLRGTVPIRHEPSTSASSGQADERPAPGDTATFVDRKEIDRHGADAPVLHYVLVGVVGRSRQGPAAGPYEVTLANEPAAPTGLGITYDQDRLTLTWQPGERGTRFRVYEATPSGVIEGRPPLSPLLDAPPFTEPVAFGSARCLAVRGVRQSGAVVIDGPLSSPRCETPVDTFPPPVPSGLVAFPGDAVVELSWDSVNAGDLAGYVVLRGEGTGDKLLRLTTKPMPDLHYTDRDVKRGTTYWYAVVAEDARGNASPPSAKQSATVRIP
jgi:hypothetical protein